VEDTERSQIAGSKHKKIIPGDEREHRPSKKTKEKQPARYHMDAGIKMGVLISMRDVYVLGRTVWYIIQDE